MTKVCTCHEKDWSGSCWYLSALDGVIVVNSSHIPILGKVNGVKGNPFVLSYCPPHKNDGLLSLSNNYLNVIHGLKKTSRYYNDPPEIVWEFHFIIGRFSNIIMHWFFSQGGNWQSIYCNVKVKKLLFEFLLTPN